MVRRFTPIEKTISDKIQELKSICYMKKAIGQIANVKIHVSSDILTELKNDANTGGPTVATATPDGTILTVAGYEVVWEPYEPGTIELVGPDKDRMDKILAAAGTTFSGRADVIINDMPEDIKTN